MDNSGKIQDIRGLQDAQLLRQSAAKNAAAELREEIPAQQLEHILKLLLEEAGVEFHEEALGDGFGSTKWILRKVVNLENNFGMWPEFALSRVIRRHLKIGS